MRWWQKSIRARLWMVVSMAGPVLESERFSLRGLGYGDADAVFAYASNAKVAENTGWHPHKSIDDSDSFIARAMALSANEKSFEMIWGIVSKLDVSPSAGALSKESLIGTIEISYETDNQLRIDYALSEQYWNQGVMSEVASVVIDWAFEQDKDIAAIRSGALSKNKASLKVMEKCGLVFQETHLMSIEKYGGAIRELTEYSLYRDRWEMMSGK